MRTVALRLSPAPSPSPSPSLPLVTAKTAISLPKSCSDSPSRFNISQKRQGGRFLSRPSEIGIPSQVGCMASQAVDLFPSICPEIVVRDARVEDCWEVADTHCSSFFPNYTFPVDLALRIDRFVALLSGFSVPPGCMRTCLVAVQSVSQNVDMFFGRNDFTIGLLEGKFNLRKGPVAGILTVDTVADYLPRKGPFRQRRTGIAYISNVAVRKADRRKGIATLLLKKAESRARSWGCRSIALHCDANNAAATRLYKGCGFKVINVPKNARWPQPKASPDLHFHLMMKLLA